jgi:hypothetical protein
MNTKCIHHLHPHSPFTYAHSSPTGTHPWKRPVLPFPVLYFLKVCVGGIEVSSLFYNSNFQDWSKVISHCGFDLMINDAEYFSYTFW